MQLVLIACRIKNYRSIFTFTSCKAFLKNKKISGTSLPTSFSEWFLKKNISIVIFYYLTNFHCLVSFTLWGIRQYVCCNCLLTRLLVTCKFSRLVRQYCSKLSKSESFSLRGKKLKITNYVGVINFPRKQLRIIFLREFITTGTNAFLFSLAM